MKLKMILIPALLKMLLTGCTEGRQKNDPDSSSGPGIENDIISMDSSTLQVTTVATNLTVPWEIAWGPDNWIWMTEQKGVVSKVNPETGEKKVLLNIPDVYMERTLGLLGMAIHPEFEKLPFLFLSYTFLKGSSRFSRVVRFTYSKDSLVSPLVLIDEIPGNTGHNGSRIAVAPDGTLMISTGDALRGENAQQKNSLNGKILRINIDGTIPADNPFPGNPVWSMGHRNVQGLVFGLNDMLYSSEHGDASDDEINIIQKGKNYGWPEISGYCDQPGETKFCTTTSTVAPIKAWTPCIAPAGIGYYRSAAIPEWTNSILLTTLKKSSLYVLQLDITGKIVTAENVVLDHVYGRLRDICISPSGDIYLSTSNRDWNPGEGFPKKTDDRIIRIRRSGTTQSQRANQENTTGPSQERIPATCVGSTLYVNYCASCHKTNGGGITGSFPALTNNPVIGGDKKSLISIVLSGLSGTAKNQQAAYPQDMPSFIFLSDNEMAEILTYIRASFNKHASAVTSEEVSAARKQLIKAGTK